MLSLGAVDDKNSLLELQLCAAQLLFASFPERLILTPGWVLSSAVGASQVEVMRG